MTIDEQYMLRCIELAQLGKGKVSPNPMVGCVIVHNGKIIAEGWHEVYGGNHAEVNAIQQVQDKKLLSESTLYVNLEPCNHYGKTPPCADLIVASKIKRVVVGMIDPFSLVSGAGIAKLKSHQIEVVIGVLREQCELLNKRFITFNTQHRPYIILKWAQTSDGFLAPDAAHCTKEEFEEKRHITGFKVQALVHKWRGEEDAIMLGTNTIITDNPTLNTRAFPGKNPIRVILDLNGRLPADAKVFDGSQRTVVFLLEGVTRTYAYAEVNYLQPADSIWPQIWAVLYQLKIQSIIIEGGAITLNSLIAQGEWDEAQVFVSLKKMEAGIKAPAIQGEKLFSTIIDHNQLTIYARNTLFTA